MNSAVVLLLIFLAALFLFPAARLVIQLQRAPFMLLLEVGVVLLVLLIIALQHGGHEPLEKLDVCTPPATAQPRAPQPEANLQGCSNYHPAYLPGSIPVHVEGLNPDGTRKLPGWASNP